MFKISEQPDGTAAATARAMHAFAVSFSSWRCRYAMFSVVELGTRTPP